MVARIRLSESPRQPIDEELAAAVEMARRVDEPLKAERNARVRAERRSRAASA